MRFMYRFRCCLSHAFNTSTKYLTWSGAPIAQSMQTFLLSQRIEQMEGIRTCILFGAAICVIEDGASFNNFFLFSIKNRDKNYVCAYVVAEFCFDPSYNCEWNYVAVFFFHFHIVWIGEEPGTTSFNLKRPRLSKLFRHYFIIKFKLQFFGMVFSCFNVYKIESNTYVLCRFIFPIRKIWD